MGISRYVLSGIFAVLALLSALPSQATLIQRAGGTMVYDDVLNVTWLSDANAARGSGYDNGVSPSDGLLTWDSARNWVENLSFGGFSDWRMPTTLQPDSSCLNQIVASGVLLSFGSGCTGSEMGYMFYANLGGGVTGDPLSLNHSDAYNLFANIDDYRYWSSTESAAFPGNMWAFLFTGYGDQFTGVRGLDEYHVWAIRSGDVLSIPEPATLLLMAPFLFVLVRNQNTRHLSCNA